MYIAQLRNKLLRSEEDMEDLLTSNVFGIWRYLPPQLGLLQFLETSERLDGANLSIRNDILKVNFQFWPWFDATALIKGAEPDVLVELELSDHSKTLIMIESKFLSSKSSFEDESSFPNDQLAREICILRKLTSDRGTQNNALIYVTAHTRLPRQDILESTSELLKKTGYSGEDNIYWTTWRRMPEILNRKLFSEANNLSPGYEIMLRDLKEIITRLKLTFFEGFPINGRPFMENKWSFQMTQKSFTWVPIQGINFKFTEIPADFVWPIVTSRKYWRFTDGNI